MDSCERGKQKWTVFSTPHIHRRQWNTFFVGKRVNFKSPHELVPVRIVALWTHSISERKFIALCTSCNYYSLHIVYVWPVLVKGHKVKHRAKSSKRRLRRTQISLHFVIILLTKLTKVHKQNSNQSTHTDITAELYLLQKNWLKIEHLDRPTGTHTHRHTECLLLLLYLLFHRNASIKHSFVSLFQRHMLSAIRIRSACTCDFRQFCYRSWCSMYYV